MTGVVGALVALAAVLALLLVLAVRPPARRLARAGAALRSDVVTGLGRLRALREARPVLRGRRAVPSAEAEPTSSIGGRAGHRRVDGGS